ncbi:hypothetical protein QBC35DRAFT_469792 [Podospora australis]|uniref:Uncharacterized protein n=1 Tax=Podospora australis TaxID=1536484 RepID=A0AAN6X5F1_9PEZI|nr:hypothetical protein QBC35DRAFT_469792 [Podospora australis]
MAWPPWPASDENECAGCLARTGYIAVAFDGAAKRNRGLKMHSLRALGRIEDRARVDLMPDRRHSHSGAGGSLIRTKYEKWVQPLGQASRPPLLCEQNGIPEVQMRDLAIGFQFPMNDLCTRHPDGPWRAVWLLTAPQHPQEALVEWFWPLFKVQPRTAVEGSPTTYKTARPPVNPRTAVRTALLALSAAERFSPGVGGRLKNKKSFLKPP